MANRTQSQQRVTLMRLSVHGALTAQYVANGMDSADASKAALKTVTSMKPAALARYYEEGR